MGIHEWLGNHGGKMFDFPEIFEHYKDRGLSLVVVGDARCVWDDLEAFGCRVDHRRGSVAKEGWHFLTINRATQTFPGHIEHAYSNEAHILKKFIEARRYEYKSEFSPPVHTHSMQKRTDCRWIWPWGGWGTSGLGACFVGLGLGYDRLVLCGIPLDNSGHNGEPHWRKGNFLNEAASPKDNPDSPANHWKVAMTHGFDGRVKSMSGRTKTWLGAP